MAELLTRKDKKQMSQWIGRDSQFELLYKVSRDGMSYQRFHELCDNKGPTVTIFYNKDNNVYGGYLSDSWRSTGTWCTDQGSFLFQLHSAGNWKPKQFPYKIGENHLKDKSFGPWFFSLPSFYSHTSTDKFSGSYYKLETQDFFDGQRFDMKGETAQSVANSHNNVIDLEVYLVKDIPHLVFLTKTDEICELVEISKMFTSSLVEDAVNKAADIIAIPRSHVLPVKNYEKETILNMDINILALMALRKSLMFADDFLENLYDWQLDNIQTLNKKD